MESYLPKSTEFLNKKIVVTGASSGIGSAVATYFLNSGASVILVGRDIETLKSICMFFPEHSTIMTCDLTRDIQIYDLKSSIVEKFGLVDILVNCAGIKFDSDIEKTFPQDYDYSIDVNLRCIFLLIKNLLNFFSENACIVNLSCLYGTRPMQGLISCCMANAGLEAFTKSAALEFAQRKLRINCVTSCPVISNSLRYARTFEGENKALEKKMKNNIPLGRMAHPDDVAKAVVFLCSDRAKNLTGKIIKVDGGRSLTSSGYVHYKGYMNMNSRFEADSESLGYKIGQTLAGYDVLGLFTNENTKMEDLDKMDDKELEKFIKKKMEESNFATRLSDAHKKIVSHYRKIETNDNKLMERYSSVLSKTSKNN